MNTIYILFINFSINFDLSTFGYYLCKHWFFVLIFLFQIYCIRSYKHAIDFKNVIFRNTKFSNNSQLDYYRSVPTTIKGYFKYNQEVDYRFKAYVSTFYPERYDEIFNFLQNS
jgi:hypothetical protein